MWQVKPGEEHEYEAVSVSGEGAFFVTVPGGLVFLRSDQVHEVCDVCQEPPNEDDPLELEDPLGHFKAPLEVCDTCAADPAFQRAREAFGGALVGHCDHAVLGVHIIAHGQCGIDQGLELA